MTAGSVLPRHAVFCSYITVTAVRYMMTEFVVRDLFFVSQTLVRRLQVSDGL